VRVPDGEPAVGPLDQQQLGAGPPGCGARAQDHQVALVPGAGVIAHRVRHDLGNLAAWQPRIPITSKVAAQRGQHLARFDDRVRAAEQPADELPAQGRVDLADGRGVKQLEPAPIGTGLSFRARGWPNTRSTAAPTVPGGPRTTRSSGWPPT
jgi:hypothetical protein